MHEVVGSIPIAPTNKKEPLSTKTKVLFLNDVCLRQMMTASPNDVRCANDVCLAAHWGKHRIIAERSEATSYLRSKCIISPKGDASLKIQGFALIYWRKSDIIKSRKGTNKMENYYENLDELFLLYRRCFTWRCQTSLYRASVLTCGKTVL